MPTHMINPDATERREGPLAAQIRNARKATAARKRAAFEFQTPNKKPLTCAKGYDFDATSDPYKAAGSEQSPNHTEVTGHEFCLSE